jgi:DNA-binding PucR family transcriptional regulator
MLALPHQGTFVVVAAETTQTIDEPLPRVEQALRGRDVGSVWRLDADLQIGLLTLPRETIIAPVCTQLAGLATARVGVSQRFSSLEVAPQALRQARVACLAAAPGSRDVVRYEDQPVAVLLASAPEAGSAFARAVLGSVLAQPSVDREVLLGTLRTWFARGGSASAAAAQLYVHRNTVRYRLRRIEELTGRSLADPEAIGQIHLAMEAVRIFGLDQDPTR